MIAYSTRVERRWAVVFAGSVWEAVPLQALLDERGIPTSATDSNLIENPLADHRLLRVPLAYAEEAEEILRIELGRISDARRDACATLDPDAQYLRRLVRPMGWYAASIYLAPIGFTTGWIYWMHVRRRGTKLPEHRDVLLWWAACAFESAAAVAFVTVLLRR